MEAEGYHIAMQPIQLTPGRFPLPKPYPDNWSIERQIIEACREGNLLLESDSKVPKPPSGSVNPDPKTAVQDNLAAKSTNPYVRARGEIMSKMTPKTREIIEKMEAGTLKKDARYDKFLSQIIQLGDKFSASND